MGNQIIRIGRESSLNNGSSTRCVVALAAALVVAGVTRSTTATTIAFANPTIYTESAISSTSGTSTLTVADGTKYAVGDMIRFNGAAASNNPFGTTATRYYVTSITGNTVTVATSPGGTALNASNTTSANTSQQSVDWFNTATWTGGAVPNGNSDIADFGTNTRDGSVPILVNGAATVYGITFAGSANGDLLLGSGANGTGYYALTLATNDSSTPKLTLSGGSNSIVSLGASGSGDVKLKIAGTQGVVINSSAGGSVTGTGTAATSTAPGKQVRIVNVDWSSFSGGIQVERGVFQSSNGGTGVLPSQTLTVGNAQTVTNNQLAGFNLNGNNNSVDALNGNSLGRVYGAGTFTVGANNGAGDFGGVIGRDFTGANTATNLTKSGNGTQTISGSMAGTGTVTVNGGTLVISGTSTYAPAGASAAVGTTVNSGGSLLVNGTYNEGTTAGTNVGRIRVNSGGTLGGGGTIALLDTSGGTTGISVAGVLSPGSGGIGTLTVDNTNSVRSALAIEAGGTLAIDLGAGRTADRVALTGGKTTAQIFFSNNIANFTDLTAGSLLGGQYTLFTATAAANYSGLTLDSNNFITGGLTIGSGLSNYTTSLQEVGSSIVLNVNVPEPASLGVLGGAATLLLRRRNRRA